MKTWQWYHPPILFPIFLTVLIVSYVLMRHAV